MAEKRVSRKNSKWKKLFWSLLAIDLFIIIVLLVLIFWPIPEAKIAHQHHVDETKSSEFIIRTTRENLDELINAYLDKLLQDSKYQYSVSLEDDVHLMGELPVFSTKVPLSLHLEPIAQKNGDVVLKQKSISIGLLELPNKKIMEYMKKYLPMPEWVTINPKKAEIYVAVTQMKIKSNFHVRVEHLDLEANNIAIKLKVPYRKLGIDPIRFGQ
ncbi:YpmS family protein [Virgibacillus sp. 179-BFC.A HS]|uniref:YpmS family protein n=1 Tax=Tigheibacillus jepli TaxID=3035914 RepID=A0ABU5CFV5_9BACI|nr:YpmS family protein [Virgibacillus sp. 179-BFC.A HS]MDY0404468.1 YpmS family protein [Virgibacillus sp. 179-BFC.A HS]